MVRLLGLQIFKNVSGFKTCKLNESPELFTFENSFIQGALKKIISAFAVFGLLLWLMVSSFLIFFMLRLFSPKFANSSPSLQP